MIFSRLGRMVHSIHARLLLVIVVSGMGIHFLLLGALAGHRAIMGDAFRNSVAQYVKYLADDLGSPPELHRAVEVAERTGMTIHYTSPEASWSTSGQPPLVPVEKTHIRHSSERIQAGFSRGHHYLIYRADPERSLLFEITRDPAKDARLIWMGLLLILLVTLLLTGSCLWIRRIMAPLRPLTEGVREVGSGRLDHRVPVRCLDELGELASAFNGMAERLQHLMRSKEQMLLDVSHELRSPLTRMKVALEMAPDGALKESLHEDLGEMERMVTTILANARAQSPNLTLNRQRVDLVSLIAGEMRAFENQPPGVILEEASGPIELFLDPEKMKAVLRNVMENALKYSKESETPVAIRVRRDSESTIVEVEDKGIGICERDLPFVFEPFYRVDRSRSRETGGFGLGLSLCKAVMEAHGGSISIKSAPGMGTTVQLLLPGKK